MSAAGASLKTIPMPINVTNAGLRHLNEDAADMFPTRWQHIERIKTNVMAWTEWKPADVADRDLFKQGGFADAKGR